MKTTASTISNSIDAFRRKPESNGELIDELDRVVSEIEALTQGGTVKVAENPSVGEVGGEPAQSNAAEDLGATE